MRIKALSSKTARPKGTRSRGLEPTSDRAFEAQNRAFHALSRMRRDGLSLRDAAREEGTTPATIRKRLPAALRKTRTGRWVATKSDRYARILSLPGPHGPVTLRARQILAAQTGRNGATSLSPT